MSSESCIPGHPIQAKSLLRPAKWASERWIVYGLNRRCAQESFPKSREGALPAEGTTQNLLCLRSGCLL